MAEDAIIPAPNVSMEPDPMLGAFDVIDDVPHQEREDMFLSKEEWFGVAIADVDEKTDPCIDLQGPEPIDLPSLNGAAEPHDNPVSEQIQAPTCQVGRLSESLQGKETWCATGQNSQAPAHELEGRTPLGMAHGPPNPADSQTRGSTILERKPVNLKALVHTQMQRPVLNESASMHTDPWPNAGTIHTDLDIYFEVSAMLEGEQNFSLSSTDSEQAVTPKIFSFLLRPLVLPPPDTVKCESKLPGEGGEPKRHGAAECPAPLKLSDHIAEDLDEAGGVCPQPAFEVEMCNVEAPNACMVEAEHEAEWPLRGQATEHKCGPNQPS
jgi:hypothetical protein